MAKKVADDTNTPVSQAETGKIGAETKEPIYKVSEFISASKRIFGVPSDCVEAALKFAGKAEYTVTEAKDAVKKFMEREVK